MAKNRQCLCCSEKFSYCPDCSRADKLAPAWKSQFCSEDCMILWTFLSKYNMNLVSKAEAKEVISSIELKPIESYAKCVQRDLKIIFAEEKKPRKIKRPEPVVELEEPEPVEVQIEQPIIAEFVAIEPTVHEVVLKEDK